MRVFVGEENKIGFYEATGSLLNTCSFKGEIILSTNSQWKLADFSKTIIREKKFQQRPIPYCVMCAHRKS